MMGNVEGMIEVYWKVGKMKSMDVTKRDDSACPLIVCRLHHLDTLLCGLL